MKQVAKPWGPVWAQGLKKPKRQRYVGSPAPETCEVCAWRWTLNPHHLVPVSCGGSAQDPANVMWLCPNHHQLLHRLFRIVRGVWAGPTTREGVITVLTAAEQGFRLTVAAEVDEP